MAFTQCGSVPVLITHQLPCWFSLPVPPTIRLKSVLCFFEVAIIRKREGYTRVVRVGKGEICWLCETLGSCESEEWRRSATVHAIYACL